MTDRADEIARQIAESIVERWTNTDEVAKELADRIFYEREDVPEMIAVALRAEYQRGQREMRERCVKAAYGYSHVRPWNDKQVWAANELKALPITGEEE